MQARERLIQNHAGAMLIVATALLVIGVVMVTSASARLDQSYLDVPVWQSVFGRQAIFAVVGFLLMILVARWGQPLLAAPSGRKWGTFAVCAIALIALAATFLPGWSVARHGSQRWIQLSLSGVALGFQPSELAKIALVIVLAWWFGERASDARSIKTGLLPAVAVIGLFVLLVGKEDFSTSFLLAAVGGLMLLVAGCRIAHLVALSGLGACGLVGLLVAAPYRVERLAAFRDIWADARGAGYQPLQSLTTIASGGWFGTGLGAGIQKYGYLPESHSDFIFAQLCEEAGVVGGTLVVVLFCAFVYLGLRTMWSARTQFERQIAFGLTVCLGLQAVLNIAVVTVMAPTTGIPLPLVSAGGSGVLTYCLAIGILAAIAGRAAKADGDSCIRFVGRRSEEW
ncbi:MAG: cell division protein FtsW [Planctomycetes bacterium]|nr:cell division protein FtsW [Planctomycetota bacterium]